MESFDITGMSCAACSARVEKAVSSLDGVKSCSVNLLTNSMNVDSSLSSDEIISAVEKAGYGASLKNSSDIKQAKKEERNTQFDNIKKRLIASLIFLIVLMYFSMGKNMFGFPVPYIFENPIALGILQLILSAVVLVINQRFFISGFKGVINRSPNMDTLVSLGSASAFLYSTFNLFKMTVSSNPNELLDEFYFESSAMILVLITVGKMLEAHSKGKTTNAINALMKLAPSTATVIRNGMEAQIDVKNIVGGDIFIVRSGQSIPVDGVIIDGTCAVDESSLTGESIPVDKSVDGNVFAGTINQNGYIKCRAVGTSQETKLAQIIRMVSDASATKAPIAKIADKVSGVFVPAVISIAIIVATIWLFAGYDFGFALARGISVLVISCPCALGLATPVAIMVGNGVGAKNGILFKNATALEETGKAKTVVLDKTGTVTLGQPTVTDVVPFDISKNELLKIAYSLEYKSSHPLSRAIIEKAEETRIELSEVTDFTSFTGNGIEAKIDGITYATGKEEFILNYVNSIDDFSEKLKLFSEKGKTPLLFAGDGKLLGIIAVADKIKEDSPSAVLALNEMGLKVLMLTGDNEKTAKSIAKKAGIENVVANVLPDGKEQIIRDLQKDGRVIMVGDGINDAPALTRADIGIAIGAGTDIAIDSADIVLVNDSLSGVAKAIKLSRATLKNIKENLFWAFFYNIVCIPIAAGALIPLFNFKLNPMLAAAAMSLSSFCVVSNALRLNRVNFNKNINKTVKEEFSMEKEIFVEGMMCCHCEARVKSVLEALPQVDEAIVSHEKGNAILKLNSEISDDEIKTVIEAQGYKIK